MFPFISAAVYACLSVAVIFLMAIATNKRIKSLADTGEPVSPYRFSVFSLFPICGIAALSALCGFVFSSNTGVYPLSTVEFGICYIAALAAAIIDLKTKIIPNHIPLSVIGIRLAIFIYEFIFTDTALGYLVSSLLGCFLCFLILGISNKISKGGIGGGDIKLLCAIGFCSGLYLVFAALIAALISCSILSVTLLLLKKRDMKGHLPFGPFIYIGISIISLLTIFSNSAV